MRVWKNATSRPREPHGRGLALVIEDDPETLSLLDVVLGGDGWRVALADGPELGLALARAHAPDVILLNLLLRGSDGLAFARAYAALPPPRAPVVLMSASQIADEQVEAAGAATTLAKPFDVDDVLSTVERVVSWTRAARQASYVRSAPAAGAWGRAEGTAGTASTTATGALRARH